MRAGRKCWRAGTSGVVVVVDLSSGWERSSAPDGQAERVGCLGVGVILGLRVRDLDECCGAPIYSRTEELPSVFDRSFQTRRSIDW